MTSLSSLAATVLFRCDAGPEIGIGHLARSAALARSLRDLGLRAVLMGQASLPGMAPWLEAFDAVVPTAGVATVRAAARAAAALVVDGYTLVDEFFAGDDDAGYLRVAIDDGPVRPLACDIVVDPNLQRDEADYTLVPGGIVLGGAPHALLAPAVVRARPVQPAIPARARRLLISCGAADPAGMSERYLEAALGARGPYELTLVVGPLNPRRDALLRRAARQRVRVALDTVTPAELFAAHHLALTTLGGTAAEMACLGVPSLATAIHERQVPHLARYARAGLLRAVHPTDASSPHRLAACIDALAGDVVERRAMAARGMELVDGGGAARVAGEIVRRLGRLRPLRGMG